MTIRRLERSDWMGFCAYASRGLVGRQTNIEVGSRKVGVQLEAHHLPLFGMTYDPKDDVLQLFVGNLRHRIWGLREFYVDDSRLGLVRLEIIAADGAREIVTMRELLLLQDLRAVSDRVATGSGHAIRQ